MPETKFVLLPMNLVTEKKYNYKSIYTTDYCERRRPVPERRYIRIKNPPVFTKDIQNPTARFINDHISTTGHRELRDRCQKILNIIGRSASRTDHYSATPKGDHEEQLLVDALPPSLKRIESEWQKEVGATKRERGDIYGKAGAKKWYHQREKEEASKLKNHQEIPGLSKWINEANEYEKMAVHCFMKNISDTIASEKEIKQHREKPVIQHYSDSLKIEDCLDLIPDQNEEPDCYGQLLPLGIDEDVLNEQQQPQGIDDPLSQEILLDNPEAFNNVTFRNPSHETIALEQEEGTPIQRCPSRASISSPIRRSTSERILHYGNPLGQRPQSAISLHTTTSPITDVKRPKSSLGIPTNYKRPTSAFSSTSTITRITTRDRGAEKLLYNEAPDTFRPFSRQKSVHTHRFPNSTCKRCQDKEIKQMADMLAGMKPDAYRITKDEMKKRPAMAISKMYKSPSKKYDFNLEDSPHQRSAFGKTTSNNKSHFVIHPEWSSERMKPKKSYR